MQRLHDNPNVHQILNAFVGLWINDPDVRMFTHARAEFSINDMGTSGVQWKFLQADDDAIRLDKPIFMGEMAAAAVEHIVRPYYEPGADHGQLTFRFNPPAVLLDIFDYQNTTLTATHLIDAGKLS